jgi:hypothetical protein
MQIEWNKIKNAIVGAAKETLGEKKEKRNEEWFDEEWRRAIQKKNNMRKFMLQRMTRNSKEICREYRRANKICREKKREMLKRKMESIEVDRDRADTRNTIKL